MVISQQVGQGPQALGDHDTLIDGVTGQNTIPLLWPQADLPWAEMAS